MVNPFVKAFALMLVILVAWFMFGTLFEGERNNTILGEIDSVIQEQSATRAYLDYLSSTQDETRFCSVLHDHIQSQNVRLFGLLATLEETRINSINNQYPLVRKRFQSANAQLFFSLKRFENECQLQEKPLVPILYFFPDKHECAECKLQAQILTELGKTCSAPIQIFAFPIEGGLEPIELLVKDYNITVSPSLVIGENVLEGIQSKSKLNEMLNC
jgi:hypothetical protein